MRLEDLAPSYNMQTDPIYGPLFAMASGGGPKSPGAQGLGNVPNAPNSNKWEDIAREMAARKYGWNGQDFKYVDWIISGGGPNNVVAESGWNPGAVNPNGGASGIPQMLPSAHPDINVQQFRRDPMQQIRWLLSYIQGRYKSPQQAYQAKSQQGWY